MKTREGSMKEGQRSANAHALKEIADVWEGERKNGTEK